MRLNILKTEIPSADITLVIIVVLGVKLDFNIVDMMNEQGVEEISEHRNH